MTAALHTSPRDRAVTAACTALTVLFDLGYRLTGRSRIPLWKRSRTPARILILKPCCMGDVVMSTATVKALREAFSQAHIGYAVGGWSRSPLVGNPRLNDLLDTADVGTGKFKLKPYLRLVRQVRQGKYDACFVLDRSPLLALLPWLAGIPHRIGINSRGRGFALTVRVPWEPEQPRHEVEVYLDTVRACGFEPQQSRLEVFPTAQDRTEAAELLAGLNLHPDRKLVVLHTGGGVNPGTVLKAKRWDTASFALLADRLIAEQNVQVVFIGGKTDRDPSSAALAAMRLKEYAFDLVGRTATMGILAAIYRQAACFVGNDSGTMHLACAAGIPVVAIFGPSDPRMYAPYIAQGVALSAGEYRPQGRSGYAGSDEAANAPKVPVEAVYAAVQRFLADIVEVAQG